MRGASSPRALAWSSPTLSTRRPRCESSDTRTECTPSAPTSPPPPPWRPWSRRRCSASGAWTCSSTTRRSSRALAPTPFEKIDEAEWDRLMAVNVKGVWLCCRAVAPIMKAQGGGRIVNVASAIVAKGTPLLMHYVASKGAVIAMTRVLARELGEHGIAVNALAPGLIMSDTARANADLTGFQAQQVIASRAFKREAVADDVVGAAVFLASADSAFITGQTLIVDGGSVFL